LIVLNGIPAHRWSDQMVAAAGKVGLLVVGDLWEGPLAAKAHAVWPLAGWYEKNGSFMNVDGRIQAIRRAVAPPGMARPEAEWLQELLFEMGLRNEILDDKGLTAALVSQAIEPPTDENAPQPGAK
jgi:predicted molibdopterin-dependent oxidoreductase YjgC